jgi:hypothetical protein
MSLKPSISATPIHPPPSNNPNTFSIISRIECISAMALRRLLRTRMSTGNMFMNDSPHRLCLIFPSYDGSVYLGVVYNDGLRTQG